MSVVSPASGPQRVPMLYVSLIVEALRARPELMFWIATLAQAALWTLVPAVFYSAPPGNVPLVLAIGREWMLGSVHGPPLAYWLAELAFRASGSHVIGLYLLSQLCVVVTFWAVFRLGRYIVGAAHAAMAILLMTGIAAFTVPTLEYGPNVLAMPLTALALLYGYRALAEGQRTDWLGLGLALGLLVLTTYAGLILVALIFLYIAATPRGRARLRSADPYGALLIMVLVNLPHLIWLYREGVTPLPALSTLAQLFATDQRLWAWLTLVLWLAFSHAGLIVLMLVAGGMLAGARSPAPVFERAPVEPFARAYVYYFALALPFLATLIAVLFGRTTPVVGAGPLVVLSGLALILASGDAIKLHRQRTGGLVWLALLVGPPAIVAGATLSLPWTAAVELEVSKPASAMGEFFTETFRRRTERPLQVVVGDLRTAGLVALASPDRPKLALADADRSPWVTDAEIREKGAVVVWPATDLRGVPPEALQARFPELVPELPRAFARTVQGRIGLLRIGWGVIRPAASQAAPPAQ
jgi:hypothetical protein